MRRIGLFLVAVVLMVGCGSGDSPPQGFVFIDGKYDMKSEFVKNECTGMTPSNGTTFIRLESGPNQISISGRFQESNIYQYSGDVPDNAKFYGAVNDNSLGHSFSASYQTIKGQSAIWEGHWEDATKILAGTRKSTSGCLFEISWTAELLCELSYDTPYGHTPGCY